MRLIAFFMMLGIFTTTELFAQLPIEEIWRIEMNSATGLGGAWTDEDGNHNVVVGDGWQAKVVSNEEIIWTSDSLIEPITALIRVPYNDGAQIVVAALEPLRQGGESYGHLYRFGGDDFELFSDVQLLGTGLGEDNV